MLGVTRAVRGLGHKGICHLRLSVLQPGGEVLLELASKEEVPPWRLRQCQAQKARAQRMKRLRDQGTDVQDDSIDDDEAGHSDTSNHEAAGGAAPSVRRCRRFKVRRSGSQLQLTAAAAKAAFPEQHASLTAADGGGHGASDQPAGTGLDASIGFGAADGRLRSLPVKLSRLARQFRLDGEGAEAALNSLGASNAKRLWLVVKPGHDPLLKYVVQKAERVEGDDEDAVQAEKRGEPQQLTDPGQAPGRCRSGRLLEQQHPGGGEGGHRTGPPARCAKRQAPSNGREDGTRASSADSSNDSDGSSSSGSEDGVRGRTGREDRVERALRRAGRRIARLGGSAASPAVDPIAHLPAGNVLSKCQSAFNGGPAIRTFYSDQARAALLTREPQAAMLYAQRPHGGGLQAHEVSVRAFSDTSLCISRIGAIIKDLGITAERTLVRLRWEPPPDDEGGSAGGRSLAAGIGRERCVVVEVLTPAEAEDYQRSKGSRKKGKAKPGQVQAPTPKRAAAGGAKGPLQTTEQLIQSAAQAEELIQGAAQAEERSSGAAGRQLHTAQGEPAQLQAAGASLRGSGQRGEPTRAEREPTRAAQEPPSQQLDGRSAPPGGLAAGFAGLVVELGKVLSLSENVQKQLAVPLSYLPKAAVAAADELLQRHGLPYVQGAVLRVTCAPVAGLRLRLGHDSATAAAPTWGDVRVTPYFGELLHNLQESKDARRRMLDWVNYLSTFAPSVRLELDPDSLRPAVSLGAAAPLRCVWGVSASKPLHADVEAPYDEACARYEVGRSVAGGQMWSRTGTGRFVPS
ncbi:hypothetical protein GPECTOR_30g173 [Gonium pectorale]|uniref:Uncharacterized protein n=1 Tax=Gonium pectorale TaxID=33097 RepID=A0A150GE40_GONPE|nr:hypothetical protein GPECTOR_30g173 [Gonium pectorale]|eukprot:KXZ48078.1 hypothetical protein GPECTOR_30g173 [Gonium pectorale]